MRGIEPSRIAQRERCYNAVKAVDPAAVTVATPARPGAAKRQACARPLDTTPGRRTSSAAGGDTAAPRPGSAGPLTRRILTKRRNALQQKLQQNRTPIW